MQSNNAEDERTKALDQPKSARVGEEAGLSIIPTLMARALLGTVARFDVERAGGGPF